MKKATSIFISVVLMINLLSFNAFADNNQKNFSPEEQKILDSLIDISCDEIPENVEPLKFDSEEEFLEYYNTNIDSNSNVILEELDSPKSIQVLSSTKTATDEYYIDLIKVGIRITYICIQVTHTYTGESKYRTIKTANSSCSLGGYTLGLELSGVSTSVNIDKDKHGYTVMASGSKDYYLLIDGLIKLYSTPFSFTKHKRYDNYK